jgi:hypothetical protein
MAFLLPEQALYKLLTGSTALVAIVGTRIGPATGEPVFDAGQGITHITYRRVDTIDHVHMTAASGLQFTRIQVDCFSKSYSTTKSMIELLRSATLGYSGTVTVGSDTVNVQEIQLENAFDAYVQPKSGQGIGLYKASIDVILFHNASIPTFA